MQRPATSTSSSVSEVRLWKSPIPYLFGSLALMLLLIAVALIILVCSYRKRVSNSSGENEDKPAAAKTMDAVIDTEPRIVVIMAGDDKPTYLATPSIPSTHPSEQV
ncbi:protein GLUTAMINE DUMPER 6-like [Juglans regia]|uniref:Protein GLUTAMINE DUMPER 6-like n=1 Tax=Juglans regia TaxID=51240 RepID=A0A2I4EB38_JUGRE|nr:protein GLUTAMINE DUMPER 6-like [Juglans regia]